VGAVWVTDRVERFVPPRRGRRHALRVINDLLAFEPGGTGTDLAEALHFVEPVLRRRAVIFVVSDFLTSGYQPTLERLARRHDVVALQLYDPRERELPDLGLVSFYEAESGAWRLVDTGKAATRELFNRRATDFDRSLQQDIRQRGADLVRLETGRSYAESLIAFFRRRERAQRR
jgi:uncharacterized protein (DUF58 family)